MTPPDLDLLRKAADAAVIKIQETFRRMDLSESEMNFAAYMVQGMVKGLMYGLATSKDTPKEASRRSEIISTILKSLAGALDEVDANVKKPQVTH